jgi:hypothetical protein
VIPLSQQDPIARNLLAIMPVPNIAGVRNNFRVNNLASQSEDQYDARVDQIFSTKDSLFGRWTQGFADITYPNTPVMIGGQINPLAYAQGSATAGSLRLNHAPSAQATIQEIHVFSPAITNQLALGYTRFYLSVTPLDEDFNNAAKLGVQGANTGQYSGAMVALSIASEQGFSASNIPEVVPQNTWQVNDTVSYIHPASLPSAAPIRTIQPVRRAPGPDSPIFCSGWRPRRPNPRCRRVCHTRATASTAHSCRISGASASA